MATSVNNYLIHESPSLIIFVQCMKMNGLFFLLSALLTVRLGSGQQPTQLPTTGELANNSTIQYL